MIIHVSDRWGTLDNVDQDRKIITSSIAFGILREGLIKNIGMERMKGFLIRYGYQLGLNDANKAMENMESLENLLGQGPVHHSMNGQIQGTDFTGYVELELDQTIKSVFGEGNWVGSYEALEHINRFGISDSPVCHTLVGYASGYMSTVCNHTVIAKEVSCVGKGDSECRWIVKSLTDWNDEVQGELQYYCETPIVKELEYTYEQLLEQRNYISRVSNIHKRLTEEVTNGTDLQSIANLVYEIIGIPVIIDDFNFRTFVYSGLSQDDFLTLDSDFKSLQKDLRSSFILSKESYEYSNVARKKIISTEHQERLFAPIIVRKKILGYCTFIYSDKKKHNLEYDFMILERVANAASLYLLNEKTSFDSFERMKGNFLEQLLNRQYSSRNEILKRGRFISLDLGQPFHIATLGYVSKQNSLDNELLLHEQILETAYLYFNDQKRKVLIGQREGHLVFLVPKDSLNQLHISDLFHGFVEYLERTYDQCTFKMGISNEGEQIDSAYRYYDESVLALRMTTQKKVVMFESLGIVGILINSKNVSDIRVMAKQFLGPLYGNDDAKSIELMKTLYIFLLNGGKLEQTMKDLSLSMSGLMYRIQKIQSVIQRDLRNPTDSHQLLLLLESLLALGELKV